ncbi:ankyrin repeat domain-containing protein [Rickettsiella endosymbiont of Dermanyssus gallinae]|uniref:ankyrin repeat domain-containing protein n=1 Tax=Rickettsiella endosymbiont of Dermanyssus gallinae TaxID=2856608 RepID=UPI001C52F97F|nr:ankyrin repeat domain-containing protein [Rickettsiella endosymbiont of Dermanyssus gallinae]
MAITFQETLESLKTIEILYAKNKPDQAEALLTQLLESYKADVNALKCLNEIFQTIKKPLNLPPGEQIDISIEYNTPNDGKKYGEHFDTERYKQILPYCELAYSTEKQGVAEEHALKLSALFDSTSEALTYLTKSIKNKLSVHDACKFNLPDVSQCDFKAWKKIIKKNLDDTSFLKLLVDIPEPELEKLLLNNKLQPGQKFDRAAFINKKKEVQQVNIKFKAFKRRHATLNNEEEKEYRSSIIRLSTLRKELFKLSAGIKLSEVDLPLLVACHEVWMDTQELGIVREMMLNNGLTTKDYEKFATLDREHGGKNIPEITLDGTVDNYPGVYLKKLCVQDIQQAAIATYLGKLTDCCQSLSGETGERCVIHGLTSPNSGFYVLYQGDAKNPQITDPVLAQCWVWRSQSGALVFDSLEYSQTSNKVNPSMVKTLYQQLAKQLVQTGYTHKVALGIRSGTGITLRRQAASLSEIEQFIDGKGYGDSSVQIALYDRNKPFYTYTEDDRSRAEVDRRLTEIMHATSPLVKSNFLEALLNWVLLTRNRPVLNTINQIAMLNNRSDELKAILNVFKAYLNSELTLTPKNCLLLIEKNSFFLSMMDKQGNTPLHYACKNGNEAFVKLLLEKGTVIDIANGEGNTPLHYACENGNGTIVNLLLKKGVGSSINSENDEGTTPLHYACKNGNGIIVNLLLKNEATSSINNKDEKGNTPLHYACKNGNETIINLLLKNGAVLSINHKNEKGNTPLHIACEKGNKGIAAILLGKKASLDIENADSDTPLHIACENGHEAIVALLLIMRRGAPIDIANDFGDTPLDKARENGNAAIIKMLSAHTANVEMKNGKNNTSLLTSNPSFFNRPQPIEQKRPQENDRPLPRL